MALAVVTGSASGIGAAIRARLEREGDRVVGVDLHDAEVCADLSTPEGRTSAVAELREHSGGRIDRVVACAGLGPQVRPLSRIASVNYFGAVELLDELFEDLRRGVDPAALAIVSNSAQLRPFDGIPFVDALLEQDEAKAGRLIDEARDCNLAYMGSKHALGRALRRRAPAWGEAGVRLNGVAPGATDTPLRDAGLADPEVGEAIRRFPIPIGRIGRPEEIAGLVAFLLGPEAAWIHGSIYYIDGGSDALVRPDRY